MKVLKNRTNAKPYLKDLGGPAGDGTATFRRAMDITKDNVDFDNEAKKSSYSLLHGNPTGLGKVSD